MWTEENETLVKEFKFADFKTALSFVNQIGEIAESMNHHPDIELGWGRVKVSLTTHSEGGVTEKDQELAEKIDGLQA
jgi:4a-hydroxytetrahydrobiopterin dehydratase